MTVMALNFPEWKMAVHRPKRVVKYTFPKEEVSGMYDFNPWPESTLTFINRTEEHYRRNDGMRYVVYRGSTGKQHQQRLEANRRFWEDNNVVKERRGDGQKRNKGVMPGMAYIP